MHRLLSLVALAVGVALMRPTAVELVARDLLHADGAGHLVVRCDRAHRRAQVAVGRLFGRGLTPSLAPSFPLEASAGLVALPSLLALTWLVAHLGRTPCLLAPA